MASNTESKKLRLAIIGGGIGGLTFVNALKGCTNLEVNLYEQAHQITEIGAGIALWPRTWEILKSLGLGDELLEQVTVPGESNLAFDFRMSDSKEGGSFLKLYCDGGARSFHRQEIQGTLYKHASEYCTVHLAHHLTRAEETQDSVKLFFQNGLEATCDILVAADGVKSVTRNCIPNKGIFYTGTDVYRGTVPTETFSSLHPGHRTLTEPVIYCGKNNHIVVIPISKGRLINVVAFHSRIENEGKEFEGPEIKPAVPTEEVLEHFSGWEPEAIQLLGSINNWSRWVLRDMHPLDTYITRRIALVGDAAHAMTPHLGAGAGQAIEDGYVLGRLFHEVETKTNPDPADYLRVLEAYNLVRQPFGNMVRRNARNQGFYYELNAPEFADIKTVGQELSPEQMDILRTTIKKHWYWWEDPADSDLARAIKFLNEGKNQ